MQLGFNCVLLSPSLRICYVIIQCVTASVLKYKLGLQLDDLIVNQLVREHLTASRKNLKIYIFYIFNILKNYKRIIIPHQMPTNTEQTYELAFTSTLIFNVVFSFVVFAIFPYLRKLLPGVFAPQKHMYKKPTTRRNYYFWFIDVFSQPISVYSTRGNLTTIYIIFQYLILMLYGIMALISITILIPVYYYGTDTSWKTHYLTDWSRLSIGHLEKDSVMHIVPIIIICIFTYFAMFVYEQFTIIYAFFTVMGGGIAFSCLLCEQLYIKIFCHFQCG
ncbi:Transmembrane_domain-containing protein [Hexamita inflata]|uniref:Transmembrane_domain-containing protein n=1 Tax=Hexamita inflata TaxID=28002 RepID=A0ABP1L9J9_9EUKA